MFTVEPHLPIELWRTIIENSAHIPSLLDVSWDGTQRDPIIRVARGGHTPWIGWPTISELHQQFKAEFDTRRSITLVSRLWHELAREFCYQNVEVSNVGQARGLLNVLQLENGKEPHDRLGWWIKRIDFPDWEYVGRQGQQGLAVSRQILEHCPNIEIIVGARYFVINTLVPFLCEQ